MKSNNFKHTELGIIPDDWGIKEFQDVMTGFFSGATPYRGRPDYYKGEIKWITSGELNYNIITDTNEKINEEAVRNTNLKILPVGTFLFAITGLEAEGTRGSCAITGVEATTNQSCMALFPKETLDSNYLYHFYVWQGKKLAIKYCQGTKQQSYTAKTARTLPIILPPTKTEQTAIATALSNVDSLIENLEKPIEKKRNIKQGVMQELLTPQQGWETKKLGELLDYEQPTKYLVKDTEYNNNNLIPVLTAGKTFILGYTNEDFGVFENLPVIIFDDFTTASKYVTFPFKAKSSAMKMLKAKNKEVILRFVFEMMQTINFQMSDHKRYWISEYRNIEIKVPRTIEQIRIAKILGDMDTDIEVLERKLTKYRMIKQGMMQTLLTGKIRLI